MTDQLSLFNVIDGHPMTVVHGPSGKIAPGDRVTEVLTVMPEHQPVKLPASAPEPESFAIVQTSWGVTGRVVGCHINSASPLSLVELDYPTSPRRLFITESLACAG